MANQIQHTYGTAAPASGALAKSEIAVRHIAANCTASSSSMLYVGEDAGDDGVTARALGTGVSGDSGQGGAAIGGNITFTGGTDITTSVSGSTVTITSSASGGSGDITAVVAGTGLSGGATSGSATLNVDAAQTQITSVGTIGTGVWQGTAIEGGYIANDAITPSKIADNAIDSEHYADGSIDNAHIADNAIDSEHYAAGSIDLEHMSSQSVDEDNIYISNSGSNGQFLSKQSGNNGGLTWATPTDTNTTYSGGTGLTLSSTTFNVDASQTQITSVGSIGTGTWAATDVAVAHGGTGSSSASGARSNLGVDPAGGGTGLNPTAISDLPDTTIADADYIMFWDATDSAMKKVDAAELTGGGGGGGVITATANGADNRVATYSAATTLNGEAGLTYDGTTLTNNQGGIVDSAGQVMSAFGMDIGAAMHGLANSTFGSGTLLLAYAAGPSDERLKKEISNIEYGLAEIKAITPKWFKYNETTYNSSGLTLPIPTTHEHKDAYYNAQRTGFMAGDVKTVMPKLVSKMEDDKDYETYDKDALIFVLVNAVKELEARVATLEG